MLLTCLADADCCFDPVGGPFLHSVSKLALFQSFFLDIALSYALSLPPLLRAKRLGGSV